MSRRRFIDIPSIPEAVKSAILLLMAAGLVFPGIASAENSDPIIDDRHTANDAPANGGDNNTPIDLRSATRLHHDEGNSDNAAGGELPTYYVETNRAPGEGLFAQVRDTMNSVAQSSNIR